MFFLPNLSVSGFKSDLKPLVEDYYQNSLVWGLVAFILGQFLGLALNLPYWFWLIGTGLSFTGLLTALFNKRLCITTVRVFSGWFIFFIAGLLAIFVGYIQQPKPVTFEQTATIEGVLERPYKNNAWILQLQKLNQRQANYRVLLKPGYHKNWTSEQIKKLEPGVSIEVGQAEILIPPTASFEGDFNYKKYLEQQSVSAIVQINPEQVTFISGADCTFFNPYFKLLKWAHQIRSKVVKGFEAGIRDENTARLFSSIVLGEQASELDAGTKDIFRGAGLSHILAASGLNVGLVAGLVLMLALLFKLPLRLALILCMLVVAFYALVTGLPPSVIRATAMLEIALTLKLLNRQLTPLTLLLAAATLVSLFSPVILQQVGFQLSLLTTLGIIVMVEPLQHKLGFYITHWLSGIILVPLVAQIWVLPLQWHYFSTISLVALPANIAVLPIVALCTYFGFTTSLIILIFEPLGQWLSGCFSILVVALEWIAYWFNQLPYSQISVLPLGVINTFLIYIVLSVFALLIHQHIKLDKKQLLALTLASLFLFLIPSVLSKLCGLTNNSSQLTVLHTTSFYQSSNWVWVLPNQKAVLVGVTNLNGFELTKLQRYLYSKGINHLSALYVYPQSKVIQPQAKENFSHFVNKFDFDQIHFFHTDIENTVQKANWSKMDLSQSSLAYQLVEQASFKLSKQEGVLWQQFCLNINHCISLYSGQPSQDTQWISPLEKNNLLVLQAFNGAPIQGVYLRKDKETERFISSQSVLQLGFDAVENKMSFK